MRWARRLLRSLIVTSGSHASSGKGEIRTRCARPVSLVSLVPVMGLLSMPCVVSVQAAEREHLNRGVVAVAADQGQVHVGWRLLKSDPSGVGFHVYRQAESGEAVRLTAEPVTKTTDFRDTAPPQGKLRYFVRAVVDGKEQVPSEPAAIGGTEAAKPYLSIRLDEGVTVQKVGIADLDGDGTLDLVIKQPADNIDPYEQYWKPSPGTYKLEAYTLQGKRLWQYDLGWAIERGIWYSPYVVYDLDGDGKAEVAAKIGEGDPRDADGRVQSGPEYCTVLDGATGREVSRVPWPAREEFPSYNYASRNQLAVAYLDGRTPSLLVLRGTYNRMIVAAYRYRGQKLEEQWRWDNREAGDNAAARKLWWGQGAHWTQAADVDGDGKDEVILGSVVLDDDGRPLWSVGLGHPDHLYVGDLDPALPGLEMYYGIESRQAKNGMCMVEAATGKILWGYDGPTRHVHSFGMCSDIDARYPGAECYSADTDQEKKFAWAKLWTAKGEVISEENLSGFGPRVVYWDADPQRELILGRTIRDYGGSELVPRLEGSYVATVDLIGDWREEVIMSLPGELRIYVTTIPAVDRRDCLLQDPIYRLNVVMGAMGYYQCPMLSYDMASTPPR